MSKILQKRPRTSTELPVYPSLVSGASQLLQQRFLVPTAVLSMATGAGAACVDTECAPAEGWDNFANNLGSDLAPLLALFGEQVTKQYLSESISKIDNVLFALAPLGLITAIVSAIRVSDSTTLRGLIGRAMESRGEVEADLMSSTSPDVCELWSGAGVVRVLGRPHLLQLVRVGSESPLDDSAGLYTFQEAIHKGLYRQQGSQSPNAAPVDGSNLDSSVEELRNRQTPPNLSLNVSTKPLPKVAMVSLVIVGVLVQGGVLAFAAIAQYTLKLTKNDLPPPTSGFPVFVAGTVFLAVGMFLCAQVVELSTEEVTYLPAGDGKTVIWLQQGGQTVGDQRFGSFARRTKNATIITSQKSKKTARFDLVLLGISTTLLGFIAQFVALRQMHSTVTVAQLGAVLVMTVIRSSSHIQRHTSNDIKAPDEIEGHELDWLAKDLNGCTAWYIMSVRVVPAGEEDITPPRIPTSEINSGTGNWLLRHLMISRLGRFITKPEGSQQESIALTTTIGNIDIATSVMQTRARLASLSQTWILQDRTQVRILQNAIEASISDIYSKMTLRDDWIYAKEFRWTIAVKARAQTFSVSHVELIIRRVEDQNGGWSPWIVVEGQMEAVYCLWMASLAEEDSKRAMDGLRRYKNSRCIDLASQENTDEYNLWSCRGTACEVALLSLDTRYFGHTKEFVPTSQYLCTNTEADLGSLCAQHIYSTFVSEIVEIVADVGGTTELCVTDSTAGATTISESNYGEWLRLRPKNTNIDSLAITFHESQLGTIEEAYSMIIPALRNSGIIPNVVQHVRKSAGRFEREERWIASIRLDQWIYSNLRPATPDRLQLSAEIENRRVRLTLWLLKNARAAAADSTDLWDAAYLACKDIRETSPARTVSLLNLWKTQRKLKYPTDSDDIFQTTLSSAKALCDEGRYSLDILIEFFWFAIEEGRHAAVEAIAMSVYNSLSSERRTEVTEVLRALRQKMNVFMHIDGLQTYLDNPECLKRAAMQDVTSNGCGNINHSNVPLDLLLITNWRTPLQAAAGAGHLQTVRRLLTAEADVNAPAAKRAGRTALQAAAEGGFLDIVNLLLENDADVDAQPSKIHGQTALQAAAGAGHLDVVQRLLEEHADVDAKPSDNGRTALQAAAEGGHLEIVRLLIEDGVADVDQDAAPYGGRTALQAAVEAGHFDVMELLLENVASIVADPAGYKGRTVLQAAAEAGHVQVVRDMLKEEPTEVNAKPAKSYGRTALQAAAGAGQLEVMELLLDAGAKVNAAPAPEYGRTALQAAAEAGHLQIVKRLLASGAEVNTGGSKYGGRTALQAAASSGHIGIVQILLENAAEVNAETSEIDGRTALQAAAAAGHPILVELLLEKGAKINDLRQLDGFTALQAASVAGNLDIVHLLLAKGAEIDAGPSELEGRTALQGAAGAGYLDVVNLLLEKGADVNAEPATTDGRTALQAAAEAGYLKVVQLLLENGAQVNAAPASARGQPALQAAARAGHLDVMERLLEEDVDVNADPSPTGRTALQAAAEGGHHAVMERLLFEGADVNGSPAKDNGRTALQAAAGVGHLDAVKWLLKNGAEVNAPPATNGRTALQAAAEAGHLHVIEWLLDNGAKVSAAPAKDRGRTALQAAAGAGHLDVVKWLSENGADVNAPPAPNGRTAFQAAAEAAQLDVMEWLLENGAEVNAEPGPDKGRTALQAAAEAGHLQVMEWLLDNGADVNAPPAQDNGRTALQAAAGAGHLDVINWLLENGAEVNAEPAQDNGRTALQAAAEACHVEIVKILLDSGADYTARLWNDGDIFELGPDIRILNLLRAAALRSSKAE